jgi:hypothetical protein
MRNAEWNGRSDNKGRSFLSCAAVIYALPFLNDVKSLVGELAPRLGSDRRPRRLQLPRPSLLLIHTYLGSCTAHISKPLTLYSIMASTTAQRRLLQEYRDLTNNPPEGITAGPVSEDDLLYWEALIQGPEGTPFEGGIFPAELKFPKDYPLAPPSMRFLGEVWHPNGTYLL